MPSKVPSGNIVDHFESLTLADLKLSSQVTVAVGSPVRSAVNAMAAENQSCAVILDGRSVVGILTEHDVATKIVASPDRWDSPVDYVMTPDPFVAADDRTALDALRLMNENRFRNLPVVSQRGDVLGNVTQYDLIRLASTFLKGLDVHGAELGPEHNLLFVDFNGLPHRIPVLVEADTSLEETINAMIEESTGLASVVDHRGAVIGEFTEHDVFTKVAFRVEDLADETVGHWMTTPIAAAPPDTPISEGIHLMAEMDHRYLVLLSETNRALGVVTFRDIADYLDAAFVVPPERRAPRDPQGGGQEGDAPLGDNPAVR